MKISTSFRLILCVIMAAALLCFTACDRSVDPEEEPFSLYDADGTFRYQIVYADDSGEAVRSVARSLSIMLESKLSSPVTVCAETETDTLYRISLAIDPSLDAYTYRTEVKEHTVLITGAEEDALQNGVTVFAEQHLLTGLDKSFSQSGAYTPDPLGKTLTDTSTGELSPRMIDTLYPTDDIVIADIVPTEMGYAVDPTGRTDSTAGLQKALRDCYTAGGGTVYLPAGTYVISDTVIVPHMVTLRGDWQNPEDGTEYGTIISVWDEPNENRDDGLFRLDASSGVVGLTLYYPHQSLSDVKPYSFAFYVSDFSMVYTVKNVTILNGYRGVGACCHDNSMPAHETLHVENMYGTFLSTGAEVTNQADVGTWMNVNVNNRYWKEASKSWMTPVDAAALDAYTLENTIGLTFGDLEWTQFVDVNVDNCAVGIKIIKGNRIQFAGSLYDLTITNCTKGLWVTDLDIRWGMVVSNATIDGGVINETPGTVKLFDVTVNGVTEGQVIVDNDTPLDENFLDYDRSYVIPARYFYQADLQPSIEVDSTAALQAVLDEAGKTGGVVYVPGGTYRMEGKLTVPAGVELRGTSSVATRSSSDCGTAFLCLYGDDKGCGEEDPAFITLSGDYAGLNGIRIVYGQNSPFSEDTDTTFAVRGEGKGVYVVNSAIVASSLGIDFTDCDEHVIKKVVTLCYDYTYVVGGKNGFLAGCLQNPTVISRAGTIGRENWAYGEVEFLNKLTEPGLRVTSHLITVRGAENQTVYNMFAYATGYMVTNEDSVNTKVVNIGSDKMGKFQITMEGGSLTAVNAMRYGGKSYRLKSGDMTLYNRIALWEGSEDTFHEVKE